MKKLLFIFTLFLAVNASAQLTQAPSKQFGTIADLRAQVGTDMVQVQVLGLTSTTDKNGGTFYWNSASTATDDGITVIQTGNVNPGRWIRMLNSNTIKGTKTLSGTILTTAYPITFDEVLPNAPAMVIIQAYSANAAVPSWVSNVTTTGFTANFASVPIIGTNNIVITYLIIKL